MSSVFPGREKDWVEFGTFLYEDERTIQTFKNEEGILGKYIKVSLIKKVVPKFSRNKVSFLQKKSQNGHIFKKVTHETDILLYETSKNPKF